MGKEIQIQLPFAHTASQATCGNPGRQCAALRVSCTRRRLILVPARCQGLAQCGGALGPAGAWLRGCTGRSLWMSATLHYSLVGEPELLDVIDEDWLRDTLPNDGVLAALFLMLRRARRKCHQADRHPCASAQTCRCPRAPSRHRTTRTTRMTRSPRRSWSAGLTWACRPCTDGL